MRIIEAQREAEMKKDDEEEEVSEEETEQPEEPEEEERACSVIWSVYGDDAHNGKVMTFGDLTPTEAKDLFSKIKGAYDAGLKMFEWKDVLVSVFPLDTLEVQNSNEESFTFEVEYDSKTEEE